MNAARFGLPVGHSSSVFESTLEDPTATPWSVCPNVNPALKRLGCVIGELVETEKNYVQSLSDVDEGYLAQLQQDPGVESSVLDTIFGRIGDLRAFHEQLLFNLQLYREDLVQLAHVFLTNASQFEHLYVDFCINYSKSIRLLEDARQNRTSLWTKLTACQQNLGHQLPVETYLLKPVQRVLKYQLLLQECVKHCMSAIHALNDYRVATQKNLTAPSSPDRDLTDCGSIDLLHYLNEVVPVLGQALERMIKVADHINEKKRCRDLIDQLRTRRIDVDDWGELVLRGYFRIPGKKDLRLVLLFHRAILLCKTNGASQSGQLGTFSPSGSIDQLWFASNATTHGAEFGSSNTSLPNLGGQPHGSGTVQVREIISCANLMLVECIPKDVLAFHILPFDNPKAQRTLQAATLEMKRLWCREIKRLILENYDAAIPEKAKHIVLNMSELSTARGVFNPCAMTAQIVSEPNPPHGTSSTVGSPSATMPRAQTLERAFTTDGTALASRTTHSARTTQQKQRFSDTTVPDYVTLKQYGAHSLFSARPSLEESPRHKPASLNPTSGYPSGDSETTGGLDAVLHDVWDKVWSKHTGASNQTNVSISATSGSPEQPNSATITSLNPSTLSDGDADFRCIAVEINEERLGVEISSELPHSLSSEMVKDPSLVRAPSAEQTERRKTSTSRHHKAPAPRPPESTRSTLSPGLTKPESPSHKTNREQTSSVYIDCPNASCYDVITFGRAYEHYIAKARAQVALSPRDLDEIFSPLRDLAQTDLLGPTIRAATVPLSGNVEATELKHRLNSQRAATTDRDPFFYRHTSPAQSRNFPLNPSLASNTGRLDSTGDKDESVENSIPTEFNEETNSRGSSGASSPRHLVSRIAFSTSRGSLPSEKLTKTIIIHPPSKGFDQADNNEGRPTDFHRCDSDSSARLTRANGSTSSRFGDQTRANGSSISHGQLIMTKNSTKSSSCDPVDARRFTSGASNGRKETGTRLIEYDSESKKVNRSTYVKQRSSSTVKQISHSDLHRIKNHIGCSEPPSPTRASGFHPTNSIPIEEFAASLSGRRKTRVAPPPPSSLSSPVEAHGSGRLSFPDRAPLAQEETAKDLETDATGFASVLQSQLKRTTTTPTDALPYVDDTSSSTSSTLASLSVQPDITVARCQPAKPPRRFAPTTGTPGSKPQSSEGAWIRSKENFVNDVNIGTNSNIYTRSNSSFNSATNGLSLPQSHTSTPKGTSFVPLKGTVRTMIDRFQR